MRLPAALIAAALCAACSDRQAPSGSDQGAEPEAAQDAANLAQANEAQAKAAGANAAAPLPPPPAAPPTAPPPRPPVDASLPETPFTATSAQAAATVVETFFGLVEAGKYDEAQHLLWDAKGADVRSRYAAFSQVHAEVFAPGQVEGAAGSAYVEVPVRVYGRLRNGKDSSRPGKVVLRRVNDVPGSTAEQRQWHIYRLDG